jgi:hypothetical protein
VQVAEVSIAQGGPSVLQALSFQHASLLLVHVLLLLLLLLL